jgi:Zn-dependent membrane protease YugP
MPYFYFDYYYIILVVPVIIASLIIQSKLKSTYAKYSGVNNRRTY